MVFLIVNRRDNYVRRLFRGQRVWRGLIVLGRRFREVVFNQSLEGRGSFSKVKSFSCLREQFVRRFEMGWRAGGEYFRSIRSQKFWGELRGGCFFLRILQVFVGSWLSFRSGSFFQGRRCGGRGQGRVIRLDLLEFYGELSLSRFLLFRDFGVLVFRVD